MGKVATLTLVSLLAAMVFGSDILVPRMPLLSEMVSIEDQPTFRTVEDVHQFIVDLERKASILVAKSFSEHIRRRRNAQDLQSLEISGSREFNVNVGDTSITSNIQKSSSHAVILAGNKTYMVLCTTRSGPHMVIDFSYPGQELDVLSEFYVLPATRDRIDIVTGSLYGSWLWLAVGSSSSSLVSIVRIDVTSGRSILAPNILLKGTLGAIHMFQAGGKLYLVIGTSHQGVSSTTKSNSGLYVLLRDYFDIMDDLPLKNENVSDIVGFAEGTNYYLVLAVKSFGGSQVYRFSPDMHTLQLLQELPERETLKVVYFLDQLDNKRYILTLSNGDKPNLYWWEREQFSLWQSLSSETANPDYSLGVLTQSNMEIMIFISHKDKIDFYLDDQTAHYRPTFTLKTNCADIRDLRGAVVNGITLVSYICLDNNGLSVGYKAHSLTVRPSLAKTEKYPLLRCLEDVHEKLEARKSNIEVAERLIPSIMTADSPQDWSSSIEFSRGLSVTGTTELLGELVLQDRNNLHHELLKLEEELESVEDKMENITRHLDDVLFYGRDQSFAGFINSSTVDVHRADLGSVQVEAVNGVTVADLPREFLMNNVRQQIVYGMHVDELSAQTVVTRSGSTSGKLNGIVTKDFMRKSVSDQTVTGNHVFRTVVCEDLVNSEDPDSSIIVNQIETSDIVTRGSDVIVTVPMNLESLNVEGQLNVGLINKGSLLRLADKAVYTDITRGQILGGDYAIGDVHVLGNLHVDSINYVDVQDLDRNVVKKTGNFRLEGPVIYNGNLIIEGNLLASTVNDVLWSDVVDFNSPGILLGDYYIENAFVSEALICDHVNGIDLDKEAVLTDKNQVIQGHIAFTHDVIVTGKKGVLMSTGALINGIDVSELEDQLKHQVRTLHIQENSHFSFPLSVAGDVTASGINGIPLEGIEDRFWRRSLPQNIDVLPNVYEAVFSDAVFGESINGRAISEYLNVHETQTISGAFDFQGHVTVEGNLNVSDRHTVDGVDISDMARNAVTLKGQQTIHGYTKFLETLAVSGDLEVDSYLNGLNVSSDLLLLDHPQIINSHMKFLSPTKASTIRSGSRLLVRTLNGMDIKVAAAEIVLKDEDATINSPMNFADEMHADSIIARGGIDGVDLNKLILEAVKKSSEEIQYITAPITINGSLRFDGEVALFQVNNKDWSSYLHGVVLKDYSGRISGVKTFAQPLDVSSNFKAHKINDVLVSNLKESILTKSSNQNISGYYLFDRSISAETLLCHDIGGVDTKDLMLIDEFNGFPYQVRFKENVTFLAGLSYPSDLLNGCNITELSEMSHSLNQDIKREFYSPLNNHHLHITGNLTLNAEMVLGTDKINTENFLHNLVLKSSDDEITGKVVFIDNPKIDVFEVDTINGVEIDRLLSASVRDDEDITLTCDLDLQKSVRTKKLTVNGALLSLDNRGLLISGINISKSFANVARSSDHTIIVSGNVHFAKGFVTGNLTVTGRINSTEVSDLVALSQLEKVADVVFKSPIYINRNLQVSGLIDGVDLRSVFGNRITLHDDQTVDGDFIFGSIVVEGDLEVASINGIQIADLVVRYGRSAQQIAGQKTFNQLLVNGSIDAPIVNGMNFKSLQQNIVRKDEDVTFNVSVTFEGEVHAPLLVGAHELAEKMDMGQLVQNMTSVKEKFADQRENIKQLYSFVHSLNIENYGYAQSMFSELAYIEKQSNMNLEKFGQLDFVNQSSYLSIRSCYSAHCFGKPVTSLHKVHDNGEVEVHPIEEIPGSRFVLSNPSTNLHITIDAQHGDGRNPGMSVVSAWQPIDAEPFLIAKESISLGLVVDAGMFVDEQQPYIVVVTRLHVAGDSTKKASITTLKFDTFTNQFTKTWTKVTRNSASNLDLTWINGKLLMLVANHQTYDATDPYTAVSQLYVWQSTKLEFELIGEFIGDHVTSGLFLKSPWPVEEHFFSLAQLKAAEYAVFEENVHYTREVLIYRYSTRGLFEVFELIQAYGVVDQASFTIDNTLYLMLLSEEMGALYVYEYIPLEGFHLYQEITIEAGLTLKVIELPQERKKIVMVSTKAGLITFSIKTKGLDPEELSFP